VLPEPGQYPDWQIHPQPWHQEQHGTRQLQQSNLAADTRGQWICYISKETELQDILCWEISEYLWKAGCRGHQACSAWVGLVDWFGKYIKKIIFV
jgi:hypothetical protein